MVQMELDELVDEATGDDKLSEKDKNVNKLLRLHKRLKDVKKMKATAAADYRDQIKDIVDEIDEVVDLLEDSK